jgi:hypothetical protein
MDEKVPTLKFSHRELVEQPPLSHVTAPFVRDRKWIKKASLFEVEQGFQCASTLPALRSSLASEDAPCKGSEFRNFPIFCRAQMGTRRAMAPASPFLGYLFWRSKKGNWLSGHPRPAPVLLSSNKKIT